MYRTASLVINKAGRAALLGVGLRGAPRRALTTGLAGAGTDRQINRLVYELYGLTDEKVRIVEAG